MDLGWWRFGAATLSLALLYRPPLSSLSLSAKGREKRGVGFPVPRLVGAQIPAPWRRGSFPNAGSALDASPMPAGIGIPVPRPVGA